MQLGGGPGSEGVRMSYKGQGTKSMQMIGVGSNYPKTNYLEMAQGRFFNEYEVQRRRNVIVLGAAPAETLFPNTDPVGKKIRVGAEEFSVLGVLSKRPSLLGGNPDEFAVIPISTYDKIYDPPRIRGMLSRFLVISVVPYDGVPRSQLQAEVEQVMRSRHRLKVDQENDFDVLTSDVLMRIFDQFTQAVSLALVVISSIALMVGGIGVMAIMTISVTERTREIGVRKALGARRREILWQFLLEAVFLTSIGGVLGIVFGSGIGYLVHVSPTSQSRCHGGRLPSASVFRRRSASRSGCGPPSRPRGSIPSTRSGRVSSITEAQRRGDAQRSTGSFGMYPARVHPSAAKFVLRASLCLVSLWLTYAIRQPRRSAAPGSRLPA